MENQFENTIQKYSSMEDVKGILVTDNNGLCLGSKGAIKTISIETDNSNFLISSENDITVALVKNKLNN
ncbi:hypothetical protein LY90DRAFT_705395 [Neocallimastix californiae]|uniref:Uncharacterized protein n=1 Tax=Neocallimastix californiae TaxID=1754190 RepID=A0A1Y2B7R5_9FUNG|nr:hypothetical protein LY90DRAFT_705395 [Neocallimastix californiae]|eukprot:ORY30879.1 hypothetical protein LY90DRAFT_705395 [Neocallimastix californiae]